MGFGIDSGELADIEGNQCFVLGYEFALVVSQIDGGHPFHQIIHAENIGRVSDYAKSRERVFRAQWCHNDESESWVTVFFEAGLNKSVED